MRKPLAIVAAALLALTACTGPAPSGSTGASAPATVPEKSAAKTDQGFLLKKIGEEARITNPDGSTAAQFWITKIQIDPKCDEYMQRTPGKHTLLLDITVQTHTAADEFTWDRIGGLINPFSFQTKGDDGVTNQGELSMCVNRKKLPDTFAANSKYTGQIEIETANPKGSLLLAAHSLGGTNGWEWKY